MMFLSKEIQALGAFFKNNLRSLLYALLIFILFIILYYWTGINHIASTELADYPLSADVPYYQRVPYLGDNGMAGIGAALRASLWLIWVFSIVPAYGGQKTLDFL